MGPPESEPATGTSDFDGGFELVFPAAMTTEVDIDVGMLEVVGVQDGDFELIIADDGSDSRTRRLITRMRDEGGMEIKHEWHQDVGFRKF